MMKKISVSMLKPGMKFSRAVYINQNNILAAANVPIKAEDLARLKRWGITEVETAGDIISEEPVKTTELGTDIDEKKIMKEYEEYKHNSEKFKEIYNNAINVTTRVFEDIKNGKSLDIDRIKKLINQLIGEVTYNKNIFVTLTGMETDANFLYVHAVNVCILSLIIGNSLGYSITKLLELGIAALLHNIGMVRVPLNILEKEAELTPDEYNKIKTHTLHGYRILVKENKMSNVIGDVALQHHEQCDGQGYPRKITGEQISEYAKIVSIADVYVALTKKRAYRDEMISYEAMKNILSQSKNKFDPEILKKFLSIMSIYPIGSLVKLNNNSIGLVIAPNPNVPLRPIVKILIDEFGDKVKEDIFINLLKEKNIFISKAIDYKSLGISIDKI